MKRRILLLSVLMTLGVVTFLSSCKKEKDEPTTTGQTCKCEIYDEWYDDGWDSESYTETYSASELKEWDITCSEIEEEIYEELYDGDGDEDRVNCRLV